MTLKNSDRMVNVGDRQFFDYRCITGVQPVEESAERDEFAQMMSEAGLFKRSVVFLEDGSQITSTEEVETIMARLDNAKCVDCQAELEDTAQQATIDTMHLLADKVQEALSGVLLNEDLVQVRQWLRDCAEATEEVAREGAE